METNHPESDSATRQSQGLESETEHAQCAKWICEQLNTAGKVGWQEFKGYCESVKMGDAPGKWHSLRHGVLVALQSAGVHLDYDKSQKLLSVKSHGTPAVGDYLKPKRYDTKSFRPYEDAESKQKIGNVINNIKIERLKEKGKF